jgi:hypothetical protein
MECTLCLPLASLVANVGALFIAKYIGLGGRRSLAFRIMSISILP